ncbi:hypothetical protein DdX_07987 [Ditylenchus destructor]|uniref:Uncharacterized protein n=1 Tax=Ditylenchus destructor TaxID=166010 RepID=A0AAD4N980_9BILA|nr:hypothetical protein DdX_07987 [Ditylenchus destructor]
MGSVPSKRAPSATSKTSVQKICIDQNNGNVQSRNTNGVKRNSLVGAVGDRIRKSAGSVNSRSSFEKEKRVQSLQSQLDNAEKRYSDADTFIKVLQRENNALELRNNELMEEIGWLKQQLGSNPVLNSIQISNMANSQHGDFAESEKELPPNWEGAEKASVCLVISHCLLWKENVLRRDIQRDRGGTT